MQASTGATAFYSTLFHHRWAVPILAELSNAGGAKLVTLVKRLAAPKDSVHRTLQWLIAQRWVKRNTGHGHPMRPEYLLTADGERVGRACRPLVARLRELDVEEVALKKWSTSVVWTIPDAPRFTQIKVALGSITSRALALTLKELIDARLIERRVIDAFPPVVDYQLAADGRAVRSCLVALAPHG